MMDVIANTTICNNLARKVTIRKKNRAWRKSWKGICPLMDGARFVQIHKIKLARKNIDGIHLCFLQWLKIRIVVR